MGWSDVGPQVPGTTQARQLGDSVGSQAQRPLGPGLYPCVPSAEIKTHNKGKALHKSYNAIAGEVQLVESCVSAS